MPTLKTNQTTLSVDERNRLQKEVKTIRAGLSSFIEVGQALATIRDEKLYRETYKSFDAFCKAEFHIGRHRAFQLIDAANVVKAVDNCQQILPTNEAQARPLLTIPPEKRQAAWNAVVSETSGKRAITATHVKSVMTRFLEYTPPAVESRPPLPTSSESDVLSNLKRCWKKCRKKDRTAFHIFVEDETAAVPPNPEKLRMHDATCELKKRVRQVLAKWPEEYIDSMGHQLKSLGEEILETGELA